MIITIRIRGQAGKGASERGAAVGGTGSAHARPPPTGVARPPAAAAPKPAAQQVVVCDIISIHQFKCTSIPREPKAVRRRDVLLPQHKQLPPLCAEPARWLIRVDMHWSHRRRLACTAAHPTNGTTNRSRSGEVAYGSNEGLLTQDRRALPC